MAKSSKSSHSGPSQRQLRVGELIRRTLSETLSRGEIHDPDLNRLMITVSEVRVSPDLRVATVFALPLGGDKRDEAMEALKRNKGELRQAVNKSVTLRFSPELRFILDDSFDRMDETRRLLAQDDVQRDIAKDDPEVSDD